MIIVGLDLSLTSTGIARIETGDGRERWTVQRIQSKAPATPRGPKGKPLPPTLRQRADRLSDLMRRIVEATHPADLVVIETPAYSSKTGSTHDRSGLWWLVVDYLDIQGYTIVEVTATGRMKYATGKGMVSKDIVLAAVVRRYVDVDVTGNDEADALVLAAMGARHLGHPIEASLPQTHLAAMDGVHWPEG